MSSHIAVHLIHISCYKTPYLLHADCLANNFIAPVLTYHIYPQLHSSDFYHLKGCIHQKHHTKSKIHHSTCQTYEVQPTCHTPNTSSKTPDHTADTSNTKPRPVSSSANYNTAESPNFESETVQIAYIVKRRRFVPIQVPSIPRMQSLPRAMFPCLRVGVVRP